MMYAIDNIERKPRNLVVEGDALLVKVTTGGVGGSGDASAAKQDAQTALLTSIQAAINTLLGQTDGLESSNASLDSKAPALVGGRVPVLAQSPDSVETQYTQAGVIAINTVLLTLDLIAHEGVTIHCTSMGTTGVVTPEWSNDGTNWVAGPLLSAAGATVTTFNAAGLWTAEAVARYMRLRLSTATTAGTTTIVARRLNFARPFWLATQPVSGTVALSANTPTLAAGTNLAGDVGLQVRANATGAGSSAAVNCPATPVGQSIKASAGRLLSVTLTNVAASARYVKLFNVATAPTMGTTAAAYEFAIPANGVLQLSFPFGVAHATGIFIAITAGAGLTNNTAVTLNDVVGVVTFA